MSEIGLRCDGISCRAEASEGGAQVCEADVEKLRNKARALAREIAALKDGRIGRLRRRFYDRSDALPFIPDVHRQFKEDSILFNKNLKGFRLQTSIALRQDRPLSYRVALKRSGLSSAKFFPILDAPIGRGALKLLFALRSGDVLGSSGVEVNEIADFSPVQFKVINCEIPSDMEMELHLFADDCDVPVRLLEWRKYLFWGAGPLRTMPFFALGF